MPRQFRLTSRLLAVSAICLGILALILASPFLLTQLSHNNSEDWQKLSNIGQTYEAASAILAGIALVGVTASLAVQTRQAKTERIQIVRERHMELIKIVLENPIEYGPIIGIDPQNGADDIRQQLFTVLWLNYGRMGYQMDVLSETTLRGDIISGLFQSNVGRARWNQLRPYWLNSPVPDRKARKFSKITDSEYQKSLEKGPPKIIIDNSPEKPSRNRSQKDQHYLMAALTTVAAAALGYAIGRCPMKR